MITSKKKKRQFRLAFMWGRHEHFFEAISNFLLLFIFIIVWAKYFSVFDYTISILPLISICFTIHSFARFCHRREKKYHKLARK